MYYRKITTGMIESTYENYKDWSKNGELSYELNKYNEHIPVWRDMSDNTKCSAMEYVYSKRDEIELHSDFVESWVQATAYFMLYDFTKMIVPDDEPELEIFFDDLDFMMDEDILNDSDVQEQMGISPNFTEGF
jgi:hypothetical protein